VQAELTEYVGCKPAAVKCSLKAGRLCPGGDNANSYLRTFFRGRRLRQRRCKPLTVKYLRYVSWRAKPLRVRTVNDLPPDLSLSLPPRCPGRRALGCGQIRRVHNRQRNALFAFPVKLASHAPAAITRIHDGELSFAAVRRAGADAKPLAVKPLCYAAWRKLPLRVRTVNDFTAIYRYRFRRAALCGALWSLDRCVGCISASAMHLSTKLRKSRGQRRIHGS
jgi:hypothetical protein